MKVNYYRDDDILVVQVNSEQYDHAEMEGNFIIHFTRDGRPVRIEVLKASTFLQAQSKALPVDIKEKFFPYLTA